MNKTKIEWCDRSWNPIVGCSALSAGCRSCYAALMSKRFGLPWGKPHWKPERLTQPLKVKKPSRIFVCSMSDLGHPGVEYRWQRAVYDAMRKAPQHTYIVLTKRPGAWLRDIPDEVWVGVTIENAAMLGRWSLLSRWRSDGIRFVSVEPMLERVTFCGYNEQPDWVIAGPETGPSARACDPKWIEDLASESKVFFDKRKQGWTRREFPSE